MSILHGPLEGSDPQNILLELLPLRLELHCKDGINRLRVPRGVPPESLHNLLPLRQLWTNPLHQVCLSPPVPPQVPLDSSLLHIKALGLEHLLRCRLLLSCPTDMPYLLWIWKISMEWASLHQRMEEPGIPLPGTQHGRIIFVP